MFNSNFDRSGQSIRFIAFSIAAIYILGGAGYIAGGLAIRYQNQISDPFDTPIYWRYTSAGFAIIGSLPLFLLYVIDVVLASGRVRGLLWVLLGLVAGGLVVFVVWEIIIWTHCNDQDSGVFLHPHCQNRDYPNHKTPDAAFLLTLFGAAVCDGAIFFMVYIIQTITCRALANRNIEVGAQGQGPMYDPDFTNSAGVGFMSAIGVGIHDHRNHHNHHSKHDIPHNYYNQQTYIETDIGDE